MVATVDGHLGSAPAAGGAVADGAVADGAVGEGAAELSRRTFLAYAAGAVSTFMGLLLGLPIVGYLAAPLAARAKASWLSLGRVDTFKAGEPKLVALTLTRQDGWRQVTEARTAWVIAQGNNQFTAYNGRCTHLGCAYSWRTDGEHANRFFCPCHDGLYDASGTVLSGPPPRPLDRLDVKVDGGEVMALYQDFRLGVPDKEPT